MSTSMPESGERGFAAGRLRTALIAAIALTVAGCSTMSGAVLTDSEKALRDESQVFSETVIGGAAAGAALSGLGCALFGGRPADCIATAAAGAVVGAAGGYLVATRQAAAKEQVAEIDIVTRDIAAGQPETRQTGRNGPERSGGKPGGGKGAQGTDREKEGGSGRGRSDAGQAPVQHRCPERLDRGA